MITADTFAGAVTFGSPSDESARFSEVTSRAAVRAASAACVSPVGSTVAEAKIMALVAEGTAVAAVPGATGTPAAVSAAPAVPGAAIVVAAAEAAATDAPGPIFAVTPKVVFAVAPARRRRRPPEAAGGGGGATMVMRLAGRPMEEAKLAATAVCCAGVRPGEVDWKVTLVPVTHWSRVTKE